MTTRVQPWTEQQLMKREDVFEALTAKALKQTMKQVTAGLQDIVTAAAAPPPEEPVTMPAPPTNVAPPFSLSMLEGAVTATWTTFVDNELFPFLVDTFIASAEAVAVGASRVTGETVDVFTSEFAAQALRGAENWMVAIGQQVWVQIKDQLSEGFAAGESIQQLAARLNAVAGLSTPRALVTARTEVIRAANGGAYEQMVFAGFTDDEASKEWLATEDARTRISHRHADGQVVPLTQPFVVDVYEGDVKIGTENLNFPGDPSGSAGNVVNCRCSIAFVFSDDELEQDEVMTAAFSEAKVKRDGEGKFAKKATRALGGVDKLSGKIAKAGKPIMLRTKVLFGTTYQDGAIIGMRSESDERLVWDAKTEKVKRQKLGADGKYETTESLTRGATYAKYGNETGWTTPVQYSDGTAPTPDSFTPDLGPDSGMGEAQNVAESASEGVSEITPNVDKQYGNFTIPQIVAGLQDDTVPGGFVFAEVGGIKIQKGYPQSKGAAGALIFLKDEKTAKVVTFTSAKEFTEDDFDVNIELMQQTPSKKKAKVSLSEGVSSMLAKAAPGATTPTNKPLVDNEPVKIQDLNPDELKFTGKTVGTHGGKIYRDKMGGEWLFKKNSPALAEVDVVTADLHAMVGLPTPDTKLITVEGEKGAIQRIIPNVKDAFGHSVKPKDLSAADLDRLQAEQVFDWLVSNHDGHVGQFLRAQDGKLVGIDKGQSFKWFGADKLDWDFHPNPMEREPIYNALWRAHINGEITLQDPSKPGNFSNAILKRLEHVPDSVYRDMLRPYAEKAAKQKKLALGGPAAIGLKKQNFASNDVEAFLDAAVARKNSLTTAFADLYQRADLFRQTKVGGSPAPAVSAPAVVVTAPIVTPPSVSVPNVTPAMKLKPIKMSHGLLQNPQTTQYAHGTIVAERPDDGLNAPVRLRWNSNSKKYDLERKSNVTGSWFVSESYSKQAAYKKFGGESGWFQPLTTPTQANQQAGDPQTPAVAGNPVAPSIIVPKLKPAAKPKTKKFTAEDLQAQSNDIASLTDGEIASIFAWFKYDQPGKMITLKATNAKKFQAALGAQAKYNKSPSVVNGSVPPISLLQVLKVVDFKAAGSFGTNTNQYENAITDWLKTPGGKTTASKYLDPVAFAQGTIAPAPKNPVDEVAKALALRDEIHAIQLSKPGTPATNTVFAQPSIGTMQQYHQQMQGNDPWTSSQIAAIKNYTGASYTEINSSLRGKNGNGTPVAPQLKRLNTAKKIQEAMRPLPQDILVRRGTGVAQFGITDRKQLKNMVGQKFVDKGFVSTSIGSGFGGEVVLEIEVPAGSPAMYVEGITTHHGEQEVLLAAGTKFEIISVDDASSSWQTKVRLRVIP